MKARAGRTMEQAVSDLEAERDALRIALAEAKKRAADVEAPPLEPAPRGQILEHDAANGHWVLRMLDANEEEAQLVGEVAAEFLRARGVRLGTGLPGTTVVRVDEAGGRPTAVRGHIEAYTPKRRVGPSKIA